MSTEVETTDRLTQRPLKFRPHLSPPVAERVPLWRQRRYQIGDALCCDRLRRSPGWQQLACPPVHA